MKYKLIALLCAAIAQHSYSDDSGSIGYKTVGDALAALKEKAGTKTNVQGGWTIVQDREGDNMVLWSFTPGSHPAHPAAIKRKIVEKNKSIYIQMTALCQAKKTECDKLMQEFEQLNENIKKSMG